MEDSKAREKAERRQRKKKLINDIQDTLEFYFSPANLRKDIFMNKLLEEGDGYIDIAVFHKFNKIKSLTDDTHILKKAIRNSEILELSEDGSKVKRNVPAALKDNETECTIYVENLPPTATHEWLKRVFSAYGSIDYISLPRFQHSGQPKGFAFVEFHTPEEAQQALIAFGGLASLDGTLNPSDLLSIKSYGKDSMYPDDASSANISDIDQINVFVPNPLKRIADVSLVSEPENITKKPRLEGENEEPDNSSKGKKKKKRKRSKKEKEYEPDSIYLRVMSKQDWKVLRNKYLNTQKEHMKQLKNSYQNDDIGTYYSRILHDQYHSKVKKKKDEIDVSTRPVYIPNVIVKITLNEPPQDIREFRTGIQNTRPTVSYVDISKEYPTVHIRFKSEEGAKSFIEESLFDKVQLLSGDEESCYWSRIFTLWELHRTHKKKKKMDEIPSYPNLQRGKDKLVNKALKQSDKHFKRKSGHIIFDG